MSLRVPTARPMVQLRSLGGAVEAAVDEVLARGAFTPSTEVAAFESGLAASMGVTHAVGTASGGWAIAAAMHSAGLQRGDEVLTVANVDIAVTSPLALLGLDVRFVDVIADRHTIDPEALERAIGPRSRAVLLVHLYGFPADVGAVADVARRHGLVLVEDCSQGPGATWEGRPVGSFGTVAVMSCSSTKPLGAAGKAGALLTSDPDVAARARELVNYGFDLARLDDINAGVPGTRFLYRSIGFNAALDELQAAVLRVKLEALPSWVRMRRERVARYRELLADVDRILPIRAAPGAEPAPRVMVVRVPDRDRVLSRLHAEGIATTVAYVPPLHVQGVYADRRPDGGLPVTELLADELLCLPCYPELGLDEVGAVVDALVAAVVG